MGRIVKVKNTGTKETWFGWAIASGTYFQIPPLALESWKEDSHVYGSIVSGTLVVNDGTSDFGDPSAGWDWLVGNNVDAIVVSGALTCTGTINLVGADGANVSAVGDTITIHGGGGTGGGSDQFDVYDNTGGQSFTTGTITVNLDTIRKDTGAGVFSLAADEVTINVTGTYIIGYRVSLALTDTEKTTARIWLEKNATEVDGTRGYTLGQDATSAENTATMLAIVDATSGDVFRIRVLREGGIGTLSTIADGSSLTIFNTTGAKGDQGIPGTGSSTLRISHTYAITGEIKVPSGDTDFVIPFFVSLASGQTAKLVKARHKINSGTSVTCKLQKNDVDATGFTGISVTTAVGNTDPADITLADNDKLSLIVTAVAGTPKNMSFTIFLELTG